jgi:hypothetical protein
MTDDRLDGGAAAHLSLDRRRHPSLLPGRIDFELVVGWRVVAAVSGIGMEPFDGTADKSLDRRDDASQRMAVRGVISDPVVQRAFSDVVQLIKPFDFLQDPDIRRQIDAHVVMQNT